MMKYLVYCDFTTLKCDFKQFADFLKGYSDDFENLNGNLWIVNIDDSTPFYNGLSDLAQDLESAGYADKDSNIYSANCLELHYRHFGADESFHVD